MNPTPKCRSRVGGKMKRYRRKHLYARQLLENDVRQAKTKKRSHSF